MPFCDQFLVNLYPGKMLSISILASKVSYIFLPLLPLFLPPSPPSPSLPPPPPPTPSFRFMKIATLKHYCPPPLRFPTQFLPTNFYNKTLFTHLQEGREGA
jgi:hypothetical protein